MKALLWILIVVVGALFALALFGYLTSRKMAGASAAAAAERMPGLEPDDIETAAAFVDGDVSRTGLLRLTRKHLLFVAGDPEGPDVEVHRQLITGAEVTRVLPDGRSLSKPFLLVTSRARGGAEEFDAFLLSEPQVWVDRLLG